MSVWLTTEEVAALIKETPHTVAQRCAAGQIPATKLGKNWRVREEDLAVFMSPTNVKTPVRIRNTSQKRRAS